MSRQIVTAGGALEIPTVAELVDPINTLLQKQGQGTRFIRTPKTGICDAAGLFTLQEGPADGFMWEAFVVVVDPGLSTAQWQLFVNSVQPLNKLCNLQTGNVVLQFASRQCVIKGNDTLIATNTGVGGVAGTANAPVGFVVHAVEVPFGHEAQYLM